MQFSLFETPENNSSSHKLPLSEGDVTYFPQALSKNDADTLMTHLHQNTSQLAYMHPSSIEIASAYTSNHYETLELL